MAEEMWGNYTDSKWKPKIIETFVNDESMTKLAKDYGIYTQTMYNIESNKIKLMVFLTDCGSGGGPNTTSWLCVNGVFHWHTLLILTSWTCLHWVVCLLVLEYWLLGEPVSVLPGASLANGRYRCIGYASSYFHAQHPLLVIHQREFHFHKSSSSFSPWCWYPDYHNAHFHPTYSRPFYNVSSDKTCFNNAVQDWTFLLQLSALISDIHHSCH